MKLQDIKDKDVYIEIWGCDKRLLLTGKEVKQRFLNDPDYFDGSRVFKIESELTYSRYLSLKSKKPQV